MMKKENDLGVPDETSVGLSATALRSGPADLASPVATIPHAPAHSPLPWKVTLGDPGQFTVVAPWSFTVQAGSAPGFGDYRGIHICDIQHHVGDGAAPEWHARANAGFIVRACNSHYEMLTALNKVLDYRHGKGEFDLSRIPHEQRDNAAFDKWEEVERDVLYAVLKATWKNEKL